VNHNRDFPRTHNLSLLLSLLPVSARPDLTPEERQQLTDYATVTRYPGDYGTIRLTEARQAVKVARRVRRRELYEKVSMWLAWRRAKQDIDAGQLGGDFDRTELADIQTEVRDAEIDAKQEAWASYRFVILADRDEPDGLKVIDLGAGHASTGKALCGRVISTLKSNALLNESPGAGYLERRWPQALKESGAWPLISLRQAFLTGALDRLLDPDAYLRTKIPEFVERGEFGLASGQKPDGTYERLWFNELVPPDEVAFESDVFLIRKAQAQTLKSGVKPKSQPESPTQFERPTEPTLLTRDAVIPTSISPQPIARQLRLFGDIPPESWNRLGAKLIPKLRRAPTSRWGSSFG
jgi:hypothetical protein